MESADQARICPAVAARCQKLVYTNYIFKRIPLSCTYDHRTLKIRLPVRSAIYKQCTGGLVVRWVTTSESPLLYVLFFVFAHINKPMSIFFLLRPPAAVDVNLSTSFAVPDVSSLTFPDRMLAYTQWN